jgi:hypothetical protein
LFAEPVVNLIGWLLMHKPGNIKFSAVSTLDMPSLVDEPASQASCTLRFRCFSHGSPDGHNGTQALSRSLSPDKFGYSTFAYPVRYSYKRDARTSLFRPYQSSLLHESCLF